MPGSPSDAAEGAGAAAPAVAAPPWVATLCALLLIGGILALSPARISGPGDAFQALPVEVPFVLLVLAAAGLLGSNLRRVVLAATTFLFLTTLLVKLADIGLQSTLSRPFNFGYDLPLLHAGWMLLAGSSGATAAAGVVAGACLLLVGIGLAVWWSLARLTRFAVRWPGRFAGLTAATAFVIAIGGAFGHARPASVNLLADHVIAARRAAADVAAMEREAQADPLLDRIGPSTLGSLAGTDIFVVFVESYGRTTLDNPLYAPTTEAALTEVERGLKAAGYAARSAWLDSPTVGGQSWLAHATLLSGLRIDNQGRYRALLATGRRSLNRVAAEAGWHSVGVMPAIVMAWPEARWFGYDTILAAKDLDYRGEPFNWVTMPDQFTLASFSRKALDPSASRPVFAEIALISSHAPWTPVPTLIPWDEVGDGQVFNAQARSGETPETVWADADRVRDQFRKSIDYSLRTVGEFAVMMSPRRPVFVVLGDHQPAGIVTGADAGRSVPVHVFGDPSVVARITNWNWTEGLVPAPDAPTWPMEAFRDRFLETFSGSAEPAGRPVVVPN